MDQVTRFKCGGFTLGLATSHCLLDGVSAGEFMLSWAEAARGLPLSVPPVIDRTVLAARTPPKIEFPHDECKKIEGVSDTSSLNEEELVYRSFSFDSEKLRRLKQEALSDGSLEGCSTFEALSGLVWRARTRALGMEPCQETKLLIVVDGRTRLEPPLPKGYFGNGVLLTYSICQAGELVEKPLSFSVSLVQRAIRMINNEYIRSFIDFFETTRAASPMDYSLLISTWSRLAFHSIDFGWGEPLRCGPVTPPWKEFSIFKSEGKGSKTISVLMGLPPAAMESFQDLMEL